MGIFLEAYKRTIGFERGWTRLPNDSGGETWDGIARNYHGQWAGWAIIDRYRDAGKREADIRGDAALEKLVQSFYLRNFWEPLGGDRYVQVIAESLYDHHVNSGQGGLILQRALNTLNTVLTGTGKLLVLYPEVDEDNRPGPQTFAAYDVLAKRRDLAYLYTAIESIRGEHYRDIANNPAKKNSDGVFTQRGFYRSWIRRVFARGMGGIPAREFVP